MNFDQALLFAIIILMLLLFTFSKIRYDLVALTGLGIGVISGLVPASETFVGFGHAATITVAIVLMISYGLNKSGAIETITLKLQPLTSFPYLHNASLVFIAAFFSMFMNNVGALALMMPIAIESVKKVGRSPSSILMPLSFGSILGGLVTLIGTPPNIIIANYRQEVLGESFKMFDFSAAGGVIALIGILFITLVARYLVPERKNTLGKELFQIESYLSEVSIPKNSELIGMRIREIEQALLDLDIDIEIVSLQRMTQSYTDISKNHNLLDKDILLIEGSQEDIDKFVSKYHLKLLGADSSKTAILMNNDVEIIEVVVKQNSPLLGRTVEQINFKAKYHVNLLAISRQGNPQRTRLKKFTIEVGDVLLLHGEKQLIDDTLIRTGLIPLAKREIDFGKRKKALPTLTVFIIAIALAALDIYPMQITLSAALLFMVAYSIIPVRELYDAVDMPILVLLAAMIPIGTAFETTGTTKIIANFLYDVAKDLSPIMILAMILIITMTVSDILNNTATAILMAPIAKDLAVTAKLNADAFLMAVAVGASCAFLTPIGHQNNALIMGPGGYHFNDYWRLGLPLEILIVVIACVAISYFWPLAII